MNIDNIRNFCIIAHIDHGKSTLADRLMELTSTVLARDMKNQLLDKMDLEREKGITIKLAPVRMKYLDYELNLIDTPGHVDFSYEVSRSLAACEGAILVVDATQGIQAQTLANVYLAIAADLTIVPVINKVDLPAANVEKVTREIINLLGCLEKDIIPISAKTGLNVDKVLDEIVKKIPPPTHSNTNFTRGLIFDSYFDEYRGVILYIRLKEGNIRKNEELHLMAGNVTFIVLEVGSLTPNMTSKDYLYEGEIGYLVTNLKSSKEASVGDTVTDTVHGALEPLPGYKKVLPFVYAGFYPESSDDYMTLKDSVEKLSLNDSALTYTFENSPVLGFGIRIGFLGLLHLEIVKERLEREYNLNLVVTNPSTDYRIILTGSDQEISIQSAVDLPDVTKIKEIKEPWIKGEIVLPSQYIGPIIQLISQKRGQQSNISYIENQALITFNAPLGNLLTDFYDQLKSLSSGYGSFNYELEDYKTEDLVKLDFLVAQERLDALSILVHRSDALNLGRSTLKKLKEIIPRQNFKVSLQAAINGSIIAREDISAFRKDVT